MSKHSHFLNISSVNTNFKLDLDLTSVDMNSDLDDWFDHVVCSLGLRT